MDDNQEWCPSSPVCIASFSCVGRFCGSVRLTKRISFALCTSSAVNNLNEFSDDVTTIPYGVQDLHENVLHWRGDITIFLGYQNELNSTVAICILQAIKYWQCMGMACIEPRSQALSEREPGNEDREWPRKL